MLDWSKVLYNFHWLLVWELGKYLLCLIFPSVYLQRISFFNSYYFIVFNCHCLKGESKGGSFLPLWLEENLTVELLHQHFGYHKTQTDSFGVDLVLLVFNWAKHLKKFILVFLFDSHACVLDRYLDLSGTLLLNHYLYLVVFIREFDSIRHQVEENLLHPLLVSSDAVLLENVEANEPCFNLNHFHLNFVL